MSLRFERSALSNPNKVKGDTFERAVQAYLRVSGFPWCEKTRAGYERDTGDLHLVPGPAVIAQVKNRAKWDVPSWLAQVHVQVANARASHGLLIVKRPRVGDPAKSYVVMELADVVRLLQEAGYGSPETGLSADLPRSTISSVETSRESPDRPPALDSGGENDGAAPTGG